MTFRRSAALLLPLLAFGLAPSPLEAAAPAGSGLVKPLTEKQVAQATPLPRSPATRAIAPTAPAAATLAPEATKPGRRKPSPPLASLPPPKAAGPLRILLVDDDASSNNASGDTGTVQRSDEIFRALVSSAVGGRADAWSVDVVKNRENGPAFDRLRAFNVVLWYTGASYGSNNDTVGREDETALRRYLEETGGAVILVSPGYVNNLVYGQSWDAAEHPFLKEVLAVNGCYGLVERAVRGTVRAHDGTEFQVERAGATETQFSVVNPDGAAIVFTSPLATAYAKAEGGGGLPVAVANSYGSGRIVYVGFTFENIPENERAKAFETLLGAARGVAATPPPPTPTRTPVAIVPKPETFTPPPAAPPGPPPTNLVLSSRSPAHHEIGWSFTRDDRPASFDIHVRDQDGWRFLFNTPPVIDPRLSASGVYRMEVSHRRFIPLNSAYKVVARYSDGREGAATLEYPNPPQPQRPTGLVATQIGPDRVRVEWILLPNHTKGYVVQGPGLPPAGQGISFNVLTRRFGLLELTGVPSGVHEIRVATDYSDYIPGANDQPGTRVTNVSPIFASVMVGVNAVVPPPPSPATPPAGGGPRPIAGGAPPAIQTPKTLAPVPPGPPPTLITFTSENPHSHGVYWTSPSGSKTVDVFRQTAGQWVLVEAGIPLNRHSAIDRAFVAPGTVYRLVARYEDGRVGEAEATFANPKQAFAVSNLKATQTGEKAIKLTWDLPANTLGMEGYRVFASGLPHYGLEIGAAATSVDLSNLPEDKLRFVVTASYDREVAPVNASVDATVATWRGRYRVVLLGFSVERKTTDDDIFDGDGRGDEIFFGAYRATGRLKDGPGLPQLETVPLGFVQSVVMGDDNNRPGRARAGGASPTGGIRSGDAIPSAAALMPQPGILVSSDRLPLFLWQGDLSNTDQPVIVALTAFEWDNDSPAAWNAWQRHWNPIPDDPFNKNIGHEWIRTVGRAALDAAPTEIRYSPLTPVSNGRYATISFEGRPIGTRPIGAIKNAAPRYWDYVPHGFVLVRSNIEQVLGSGSASVVTASLATRRSPGVDNLTEQDEARYTIHVQIERLSPPPVKADAPTALPAVPSAPNVPTKKGGPAGKKRG
ncbi:MAG: hypothetical protein JNL92_16515 [Opitutaceae bacterium]|nr:hypothetical protein [Opitutaceae bacterium]